MTLDRVIELDKNVNPVNKRNLKISGNMYLLITVLIKGGYVKNVTKDETTDSLTSLPNSIK
jgi:hypothetical protein